MRKPSTEELCNQIKLFLRAAYNKIAELFVELGLIECVGRKFV